MRRAVDFDRMKALFGQSRDVCVSTPDTQGGELRSGRTQSPPPRPAAGPPPHCGGGRSVSSPAGRGRWPAGPEGVATPQRSRRTTRMMASGMSSRRL
jgi:hypothetical protein